MSLSPIFTSKFKKDYRRAIKRGYQIEKLDIIIRTLANGEVLALRHRDHALSGNYSQHRECHIEPDWLLIYRITGEDIRFERTGTHADLFE